MLLNDRERAEAVYEVSELIRSSGLRALIERLVPGERLYGSDEGTYAEVGVVSVELDQNPPEELASKIDALACVLKDTDVLAEDRLSIETGTFRVQSVEQHQLFGTVTHKALRLVRLYGRTPNR